MFMQNQEKQEKVMKIINLYTINKYIQKMVASKTKKLTLQASDCSLDVMLLEDLKSLASLEDNAKN